MQKIANYLKIRKIAFFKAKIIFSDKVFLRSISLLAVSLPTQECTESIGTAILPPWKVAEAIISVFSIFAKIPEITHF